MKKILLLASAVLFAFATTFAQERAISGTVTSAEDGSTLPGVSVLLKGTSTGAVTDVEGQFKLTVPSNGGTLVFSFIGMKTMEVEVGTRSTVDVQMEADVTQLSEIIVSGVAANTPREKLTVSVAKVDAETLNAVPATSVSRSLSGKVSGVRINNSNGTPGGGAQIQLRSDNNLGVGSSPLVIMDGIILEGGLDDINADDIESIEVIRGASASSLYGSRAGNGVIVITSKRGSNLKIGTTNVTVRNEMGFQQLERYIDLAENHAFVLADNWESLQGQYTAYDGVTYPAGYMGGFSPDVVGNRYFADDQYMDNPFGVNRDQQKEFFRRGINSANYVSVSTRNETSNVFVSYERNQQEGIISNTDGYGRNSFRLNFDHNVFDWLKLSASNSLISTTSNFPGGGGGIFFDIVLAEPDNDLLMEHPDGQPYYIRHNHWSNEQNPLYSTWKNSRDEKTRRSLNNFRANAEITDWLSFETSYSMELINYRYTSYNPKDTWELNSSTGNPLGIAYSEGDLYMYSSERLAQTAQQTLNFNKKFGDLIVRGKLSYLWESNEWEYFDAYGFDFGVADTPNFQNFTQEKERASSSLERTQADNFFAIGSFDYKDKILFDGLYRLDRSSLFGPDSRVNGYYRVSAAYRISEDFDIPGIQELKIRGARGTAGIRPGYLFDDEYYTLNNGTAVKNQLGNRNLRPSNTAETEVALNVSFLNKFTFEAIYSQQVTTDQFLRPALFPTAGGYGSQVINAGTVEGNTFEWMFGADFVDRPDFKWDANVTFTATNQTITELPIPQYQSGPSGLFFIREGETYGSIYGFDWVRSLDQMAAQLPEGETIDMYAVNSDGYVVRAGTEGTINESPVKLLDEDGNDAFVKIGDGNPDFFMGIRNNISYKGFTFYLLVDWKQGGDVYNRKSQWLTRDDRNGIMDMGDVADGEKKALSYFKAFYDVNTNNAYWVEDASFIKIREAALGYSVPKSMLQNFANGAIKKADLRLIGRNLKTFTKYSGYDPEVGSIRNPFDGTGTYPNFRNYALSLQLQF